MKYDELILLWLKEDNEHNLPSRVTTQIWARVADEHHKFIQFAHILKSLERRGLVHRRHIVRGFETRYVYWAYGPNPNTKAIPRGREGS